MRVLLVDDADVATVVETVALAFATDPVWGIALAAPDGSTEHHRRFWAPFVRAAVGYSTAWMTPDAGAVAIWIPPGAAELPGDLEGEVEAVATETLPAASVVALHELWERFETSHPQDHPHAYLSLLATHPSQRGRGIGQQLLAANLRNWDAQGLPAYLESTNDANLHRYERAGFRAVGGFDAVLDDARITTMWRPCP